VKHVKEYDGRFLLKDPQGCYFEMAEPKAVRKTSQAFREKKEFILINVDVEEDDLFMNWPIA
jgi:hypothetical protein